MIEKIVFNVLAFSLFVFMFGKLIRKNDSNYIYAIILQAIGIFINFIELMFNFKFNDSIRVLMYLFSIFLPIGILAMEFKGISFSELISVMAIKMCINGGNDAKAKERCLALIEKNPDSIKAHKLLAELYEKEGKKENAIYEYIRVIDLDKNQYNLYYKVGLLYKEIGNNNEAIHSLENLLIKQPGNCEASKLLGNILYDENRFKEATNVYLNAIKHNPDDYDLYYELGMVYTRLNDFQSAKDFYEKAAQINAGEYNVKYNLGQIALIYNDLDEAEAYFLESLNGKSVEAGSYYYLSEIALIKGEEDKAIQYANISIEIDCRLIKQIEKNPLFISILPRIIQINKNEYVDGHFSKMENDTNEYLENTYNLVGRLNNTDIKMAINKKKIERADYYYKDDSREEKERDLENNF